MLSIFAIFIAVALRLPLPSSLLDYLFFFCFFCFIFHFPLPFFGRLFSRGFIPSCLFGFIRCLVGWTHSAFFIPLHPETPMDITFLRLPLSRPGSLERRLWACFFSLSLALRPWLSRRASVRPSRIRHGGEGRVGMESREGTKGIVGSKFPIRHHLCLRTSIPASIVCRGVGTSVRAFGQLLCAGFCDSTKYTYA